MASRNRNTDRISRSSRSGRPAGAAASPVCRPTARKAVDPREAGEGRETAEAKQGPTAKYGRSALTNGAWFLGDVDGRSAIARRFRDLAGQLSSQISDHGRFNAAGHLLIRRAVAICLICETFEAAIARGEAVDLQLYLQAQAVLLRMLKSLKLINLPNVRDDEDDAIDGRLPDLHDYIRSQTAARASGDEPFDEEEIEDGCDPV